MSYIMVPVPEDHVADVMQHILRLINQASVEPWTPEAMEMLFDEIDEYGRSLLSAVAQASQRGEDLDQVSASEQVQLTRREVLGIVRELNELARDDNKPLLVVQRTRTETLENGRTVERRVLAMNDDVTPLVLETDRAHLLADDPLGQAR